LACSTGIGVLNGARTGTTIPDADRKGVWAHLAAHLEDAGVKPADIPELKNRKPAASVRAELRNVPESRLSTRSEFELREIPNGNGGTNLRFTGFACVTDAEYEMEDWLGPWTESVTRGAFAKTLAGGADVAFLLNHQGMTLARTKPGTLKLSEVREGSTSPVAGVTGLHSEALLDPANVYVQAVRSAVERSDLDEMSFAFRVTRQEWNDDYDRRWINEVNLDKGDVSLCNFGANPVTGGTVAIRQRFIGRTREDMPIGRARHLRAAGDDCNRCDGEGTVHLQGQPVQCPQCKGTGTGENNASDDDEIDRMLQRAKWHMDILKGRLMLEKLRYPPR
jgi:hypothetical protein